MPTYAGLLNTEVTCDKYCGGHSCSQKAALEPWDPCIPRGTWCCGLSYLHNTGNPYLLIFQFQGCIGVKIWTQSFQHSRYRLLWISVSILARHCFALATCSLTTILRRPVSKIEAIPCALNAFAGERAWKCFVQSSSVEWLRRKMALLCWMAARFGTSLCPLSPLRLPRSGVQSAGIRFRLPQHFYWSGPWGFVRWDEIWSRNFIYHFVSSLTRGQWCCGTNTSFFSVTSIWLTM